MRRREPTAAAVPLADLPDWVVGVAPPPPGALPPVPPMDPAWGFTEAEWDRAMTHQAASKARRAWLARNAPHLISRQVWAEARRRREDPTNPNHTWRTAP